MTDDLYYTDIDDDGVDLSLLMPRTEFEKTFLAALKRKRYHAESESKKVRILESKLQDWTPGTLPIPKFPRAYVMDAIAWAAKKNRQRQIIGFKALIKAIRNAENFSRWVNRTTQDVPFEEDRGNYESSSDW